MAPILTAQYQFAKPDTQDLYDVTIQNGNWDKAEAGLIAIAASTGGVTFCTSVTRPGSPANGRMIYETDTRRMYLWNGSIWFQIAGPLLPITLTTGTTINTNCALGRKFRGDMSANGVLQAPTNAIDGMDCVWEFTAIGGAARTLSVQTGVTGGFVFGSDVTALTPIEAGKTDILGGSYHQPTQRWRLMSYAKGFTST